MKKRVLIVLLCFVGALSSAFAAEKKVQGVVISSEDNLPLIGASVYVTAEDLKKAGSAQTTMGVITDVDGQFSIAIPAGITRFFCSYVGYDVLEVKLVPGKEHYEITLHASSQMLDAVVVTGYQTVERRKLTAAVSKLDISDETIGAVKSIDQALAGQIAGLSVSPTSGAPGAPAKIRIRGTASLNGTQDPLWVLDGIPLEGTDVPEPDELNDITNMKQSSIAGLNPADIENITILKDAAATAIYGARAANGVIVITTKKGKVGKPVINFSSRFTYTPTLSLDRLNLLNSAEKVGLEMDMIRNNYSPDNHKGGVYNILSNYNELSAFQNGGWDALSSDTQAAINRLKSVNTNWGDILFRDAFSQEYNLSLSGGTERVTYYTSFGYYKEDGNVDGVGMDRFNLVGKTSYKVNSILKVGASMFANRRKNTNYLTDAYGMSNPVFYSRKANPYFELYDKNGNYNYDYDIQNNTDKDLGFNIFEERQNTSNESVVNSFSSIFDAELRFNDKWKLTSQFGYQLEKTSPNKKLRWEKTQSVNAGFDFSVLNQAINLSVDYYYRKGTDLIALRMLPLETGFTSMNVNWASMENKGVEISLSTRNITTKNFSWYTNFNFAYNGNKVLQENIPEQQTTPGREGYPVGAIFALKTAGVNKETGNMMFYNPEGEKVTLKELYRLKDEWGIGIASSDVTAAEERTFYSYIGSSDAPYTGGLINTFSYKNWELNVNFSLTFGGYVRTQPSYDIINPDYGKNYNADVLNRWTPENPNAELPAFMLSASNPEEYSWYDSKTIWRDLDIWVKKLNYVRLQNLRLGYRIPELLTKRLGMNSATVSIEGRNLFVFGSGYNNYMDPESMYNPYATPVPKSVTFSLNLNF